MPEIDTTTNKLTLARNENQRLQNELDDLRRRFQGLDSRKLFLFFLNQYFGFLFLRYKKFRTWFVIK